METTSARKNRLGAQTEHSPLATADFAGESTKEYSYQSTRNFADWRDFAAHCAQVSPDTPTRHWWAEWLIRSLPMDAASPELAEVEVHGKSRQILQWPDSETRLWVLGLETPLRSEVAFRVEQLRLPEIWHALPDDEWSLMLVAAHRAAARPPIVFVLDKQTLRWSPNRASPSAFRWGRVETL